MTIATIRTRPRVVLAARAACVQPGCRVLAGLCAAGLALAAAPRADAIVACTQEAVPRGVNYLMQVNSPTPYGWYGYGCGFVDLDSDGDEDLVIMGATSGAVGIFENTTGEGNFTDRSTTSGLPTLPEGSGFAAGDYDADGDLDLYFTQVGLSHILARNNGNFTFTNVTVAAGLGNTGAGQGLCWGDYDQDGWLDIYVTSYSSIVPGVTHTPNQLYHNEGDGTFVNVAAAQGVASLGQGFQAIWTDYDKDGDVDLYLSNDNRFPGPFESNKLWRNDAGTLVNVSVGSGANVLLFSMGIASGDFDRNGWPDLYLTNLVGGFGMDNPLLLHQGDGTYDEAGVLWGVNNPYNTSWASIFFDFDNNGFLDLYVCQQAEGNKFYLNLGGSPCGESAVAAGVAGAAGPTPASPSYSAAVGDVDRDGDLDLLVNEIVGLTTANVKLFINHEGETRSWVRFRVVGEGNNLFAIGARVEATIDGLMQMHEIYAGGNGFKGQNELVTHFGAGSATDPAESVFVSWPGGKTTRTLTNAPLEEEWTVYPPSRLGDEDGDGFVLADDAYAFAACHQLGMASAVAPGCEMMDFDGDFTIELDDVLAFMDAYTGPAEDCDENGQPDLVEIAIDPDLDASGDGILDECQPCLGVDFDESGDIGFNDLTGLLLHWGPCPVMPEPCPWDTDSSGAVGFNDLTAILLEWGPCP